MRCVRSTARCTGHRPSRRIAGHGAWIACLVGTSVGCVNALTGLGYTFTSGNAKALLLRPIIGSLLRLLLNRPKQFVLVQNPDDCDGMLSLGIAAERIVLIPGSGVDVEALQPMPEPPKPPTVAYVGRLLADKGIHALIGALGYYGGGARMSSFCSRERRTQPTRRRSSNQEAASWGKEPGITWLGHVDDISALWARAHIAVLPSRREGLPKSLLEAAACGRPMIATDVPGCREVVHPGETGVLVPVDDERALADAIEALAASQELRARYGAAARRLAVERFSAPCDRGPDS